MLTDEQLKNWKEIREKCSKQKRRFNQHIDLLKRYGVYFIQANPDFEGTLGDIINGALDMIEQDMKDTKASDLKDISHFCKRYLGD